MERIYTPLDLPDDPDFGQKMRQDFTKAVTIGWNIVLWTILLLRLIF